MNLSSYKSGSYKKQYQYSSFMPSKINHEWVFDDSDIMVLLSKADQALGRLDAFSQLIPDVDFFIKMHIKKEATSSSRIEGTQTNIEEALQKIEYVDPERRDDWEEVQNYVAAMNYATERLEKLPLSGRLLKETHKILMNGVRGKHKEPGNYRESQNWIGGASLNDAIFIPPHHDDVADLMSDLEHFINDVDWAVPAILKIAMVHYQFETIHPFLDGNGRIGRLLITLFLVSTGLLTKPALYLSDFFEKNKSFYYDNLTRVRTHSDMKQWLKFFLEGVRQTSENAISTFQSIITLRQECEEKLHGLGKKSKLAHELLDYLFSEPVVDSQDIASQLNKATVVTNSCLLSDITAPDLVAESSIAAALGQCPEVVSKIKGSYLSTNMHQIVHSNTYNRP